MDGMVVAILGIICAVGLPVIVVGYVLVTLIGANNKERLELARHGIVAPVRAKPSPNKYRMLRNGILCIGIAVGLIVGTVVVAGNNYAFRENIEFLIICSSTILCLGLAYLVFFLIVKNKNLENEE